MYKSLSRDCQSTMSRVFISWPKLYLVTLNKLPSLILFLSTARYIVHNTIWGSISTISVALNGAPFSVVTSFSDGTVDNSTGIPYFYLSNFDPICKNIKENNWASLSVSEAQSDYCKEHDWDPEEPLCSRVSLTGKVSKYCILMFSLSSKTHNLQAGFFLHIQYTKRTVVVPLAFLVETVETGNKNRSVTKAMHVL